MTPADDRVPRVLSLVPREGAGGCSWWRVQSPSRVLKAMGVTADWDYEDNPRVERIIPRYDAVMFQRLSWATPEAAAAQRRRLHAAGVVMLGEFDDDIWLSRSDQKSQAELGFTDRLELTAAQHQASTAQFDGLIVSTERLRTAVHTFAPHLPVEVVGNYIDVDLWDAALRQWPRHPRFRGKVTIGWAGGDRYDRDVAVLAEAWRRVARQTGAEVVFVIQGYVPPVLRDAVPPERLEVIEWLPLLPTADKPFYGTGLKCMDVLCCSVAPTMFNAAKTPIRVMEGALVGCAIVGTPTLYGPMIEHGVDGFVAETADEWERALLRLMRKAGCRARLAAAMERKVRTRWGLAENAWRWVAAWGRLVEATSFQQSAAR